MGEEKKAKASRLSRRSTGGEVGVSRHGAFIERIDFCQEKFTTLSYATQCPH